MKCKCVCDLSKKQLYVVPVKLAVGDNSDCFKMSKEAWEHLSFSLGGTAWHFLEESCCVLSFNESIE